MDPKTKREAERVIQGMEQRAGKRERWVATGGTMRWQADTLLSEASKLRAEAARLRALSTTLPE